jgi:hypothetical protein
MDATFEGLTMKHALLALVLLCLSACKGVGTTTTHRFQIDNPTDAPLQVYIDDKRYDIPADSAVPVELAQGEHRLRSERLGEVRFVALGAEQGTLINPTLSHYVLVREIYTTDASQLKHFGMIPKRIVVDGKTYEGNFDRVEGLFIDRTWTFDLREPFPDEQRVYAGGGPADRHGRISDKLFTAREFAAYAAPAEASADADMPRHEDAAAPPQVQPAPSTLPPLPPRYEAHAAGMRNAYAAHLRARSAADVKAMHKAEFDATMAYGKGTAGLAVKNSVAENEAVNRFMQQYNDILSRSVLILP